MENPNLICCIIDNCYNEQNIYFLDEHREEEIFISKKEIIKYIKKYKPLWITLNLDKTGIITSKQNIILTGFNLDYLIIDCRDMIIKRCQIKNIFIKTKYIALYHCKVKNMFTTNISMISHSKIKKLLK